MQSKLPEDQLAERFEQSQEDADGGYGFASTAEQGVPNRVSPESSIRVIPVSEIPRHQRRAMGIHVKPNLLPRLFMLVGDAA